MYIHIAAYVHVRPSGEIPMQIFRFTTFYLKYNNNCCK